jgi:hypothetical protein
MLLQRFFAVACTVACVGVASASAVMAQGTDSAGGQMGKMSMSPGGAYTAMLSAPAGSSSKVAGMGKVKGTSAEVMISGDQPNAVRPWHVHKGSCGNDQGIFGSPSAYKPITVGSDGKGKSKATLSMALPDSGSYFVNVHSSMSDMKTIVACGNLTKGM